MVFSSEKQEEKMKEIEISTEYIKLDQLLKWANLVGSGSDAKHLIIEGQVKVNGEVETRRGKKLRPQDIVEFQGEKVKVVGQ